MPVESNIVSQYESIGRRRYKIAPREGLAASSSLKHLNDMCFKYMHYSYVLTVLLFDEVTSI